jgi:hypothetical protein
VRQSSTRFSLKLIFITFYDPTFSFSPTATLVTWALCALVLGPFLVYPVGRVMWGAFVQDGAWQPSLLLMPFTDP